MKVLSLILLAILNINLVLGYNKTNLSQKFLKWKKTHNKQYDSKTQEIERFEIFVDNYIQIQIHNSEFEKGLHTHQVGLNHFADLTIKEFSNFVKTEPNQSKQNLPKIANLRSITFDETPDSIDWRNKNVVTNVKDQGQCGSCWAFSTIESVESAYAIANDDLLVLSEQELVDCSTKYGNNGCNGGLMDYGFKYIKDNGISLESDYPYHATDGTCNQSVNKTAVKVTGFVDVPATEDDLKIAVSKQPVSVGIAASSFAFQFYKTGVYSTSCDDSQVDHGVQIVGYGSEDGKDYWILRNSWNTVWGDQGYMKLARNTKTKNGCIQVASSASYPIIEVSEDILKSS